jgi:hypothetical protein
MRKIGLVIVIGVAAVLFAAASTLAQPKSVRKSRHSPRD